MQVPLVSCGSDSAPIQRALLSGLFVNAAILLPDSESQGYFLQECHPRVSWKTCPLATAAEANVYNKVGFG